MNDERDPLMLRAAIPFQRHGEDGILFQPRTRLSGDEWLLYGGVCECACRRAIELHYDHGLEEIPSFVDMVLGSERYAMVKSVREAFARLKVMDRERLVARITDHIREIEEIGRLAGTPEGSA
jgi:hypothetical protein